MKRQSLAAIATLVSVTALLGLFCLLESAGPGVSSPALASPLQVTPTVTLVDPVFAPNDLDTPVIITGADFISTPTVYLGDTSLEKVNWIRATMLEAVVPWGIEAGAYTLTVENPGGEAGHLPSAFTVGQGIGVWNAGTLYGGNIQEMVINPITPTTLYAASEKVGLFRSQNGADHWSFIAAGTSVRGLAIAPKTLYASISTQGSAGLHRSDDGGDTWTVLDTAPGDLAYPHPEDPDKLYVAGGWEKEGIWMSENRGLSWTLKTTGLTDTHVSALAFHPTDPLTMYVGTGSGNIFISSNAGDSWSFVDQPTDFIQELAVNPRGNHELWVSNCCFCTPKETLKSTNADHTAWTPVADPVGSNSMRTIAFPSDAWGGTLYLDTAFVNSCWGEAHRTDDGGDSWDTFGPTTGAGSLILHPTDPDVAYRCSSASDGIIKTTDSGTSWQVVQEGLTALVPDQLEAIPDDPGSLYATVDGTAGIYKGARGGATWQFLPIPGEWGIDSVLVDPVTPTRVYAGRGDPQDRALIHISEDSGETWPTTSTITVTGPYTGCPNFVNALAADASQPGSLLLGMEHFCMGTPGVHTGDLYYSTDAGQSWELATVSGTAPISPVTAIAHDALTPTIAYAATGLWDMGSGLLRSTDGGQSWEQIGKGIPALDYVEDLAVEQSDPYRVFAWNGIHQGLYVSEDHGESWEQAPAPLWGQVEQILCTPQNPSLLYAAKPDGLYRSTDGAQSWSGWERASGLLGGVPIYSLAAVTATDRVILYAGTTGGYAQSAGAQALSLANGALVNAGVYRHTTHLVWEVYLPLVLRMDIP